MPQTSNLVVEHSGDRPLFAVMALMINIMQTANGKQSGRFRLDQGGPVAVES